MRFAAAGRKIACVWEMCTVTNQSSLTSPLCTKKSQIAQKHTKTFTLPNPTMPVSGYLPLVLSPSWGLINKAGQDCSACSDRGCWLGKAWDLVSHIGKRQRRAPRLAPATLSDSTVHMEGWSKQGKEKRKKKKQTSMPQLKASHTAHVLY